jgi:CheY-like chemotaxis protein
LSKTTPTPVPSSSALQSAGHRVTLAPDAQAAVDASRQQPFDLIISDLRLPDGNGHDLLRTLRTDPANAHPPRRAICLSGSGDEADQQASRQAGFDLHLQKPIDPRTLNNLINSSS